MNNLILKILLYLLVVNVITFLMMGFDKHEAKKGNWRVSEKTLFTLVVLGGSIGGILGMFTFRHKTKKWYFRFGFPIILILQILVVIDLVRRFN